MNKHGYNCGLEIFKAMDTIQVLQREAAAKDKDTITKKIMGRTSETINIYGLPRCM